MFRWQELPPFEHGGVYAPGSAPKDYHPEHYGKLELHRYGRLSLSDGSTFKVMVHATRRNRDGWSYVVAELSSAPMWVSYFHHPRGDRIEHARSANAHQLAEALSVKRLG
ncbi:MAG TPA: hypothetical protein VLN59_07500 [Burkholderiales bacterium]|nr:hypothetical protein [Burkholderiales bacterium]